MPGEIVESFFRSWTSGLSLQDQVISIFLHIRDIPYALVSYSGNGLTGPEHLLTTGKGSCGPKHRLMGEMFGMLGIPVRYQIWPFSWDDPTLLYPPHLRASAYQMKYANHLACQVLLHGHWVLVDATWDLPLEKGGFPVNRTWDGRSDTLLAVHPVKHQAPIRPGDPSGPDRRHSLMRDKNQESFVELFNSWLASLRDQDITP